MDISPLKRADEFRYVINPGRKTPGLVTLRESRVNAAKENCGASNLCDLSVQLDVEPVRARATRPAAVCRVRRHREALGTPAV